MPPRQLPGRRAGALPAGALPAGALPAPADLVLPSLGHLLSCDATLVHPSSSTIVTRDTDKIIS
jgi:hypothetical protein